MSSKERAGGAELPSYLKVVKQLGRGAYGTVYLCEDKKSGEQVAVKQVKQAARHGKSMLREIRLLARLRHENLLFLLDFPADALTEFTVVSSPNFEDIYLVLPYLAADLHKIIQSQQALTEKHVQVILVQILRAMEYLHASGVAHRDLKPANILLSSDCKLKVCDFGLARGGLGESDEPEEACGVLTEYVVTRWYRAPEVMLLPKQYSTAVDIWSVGCILGEILGRKAHCLGSRHWNSVSQWKCIHSPVAKVAVLIAAIRQFCCCCCAKKVTGCVDLSQEAKEDAAVFVGKPIEELEANQTEKEPRDKVQEEPQVPGVVPAESVESLAAPRGSDRLPVLELPGRPHRSVKRDRPGPSLGRPRSPYPKHPRRSLPRRSPYFHAHASVACSEMIK
eukprot:g30095.t1